MTSLRTSHLVKIAASAVVAVLVLALVPGSASAGVERLRPAKVSKRLISFDVSEVRGRIVRARLVARGHSRRVNARRLGRRVRIASVRRRAVVKVRAPRSWSRRLRKSSRLRLKVRGGRLKTPEPSGHPEAGAGAALHSAPGGTAEPEAPSTAGEAPPAPNGAPAPAGGTTTAPAPPTCDLASAGGGVVPGACWRPYSDSSPFNRPIPSDAAIHPDSGRIVARLTGWGPPNHLTAGDADTPDDWAHPTYYSSSADPVFELRCTRPWGTCAIEGMRIHVPDAARPAAGGDGHMTVVDAATGWEYDFYDVQSKPAGGGTLQFGWGGRTRIDGDGLGSDATASRFGNLAGIIRAPELEAGEIDHALFMVVKCDSGSHVHPATKSGRSCAALGLPTADAPPMGARFQLHMSEAQIDALPVPAWKKTILRAMARYGMYVGDTGSQAWAVQAESGSTYTSFGMQDALVTFAQRNGVPTYNGDHVFNIRDGVDWGRYLRVVAPG